LGGGATEFTYDSMNAPFLNCQTPRWWLIWKFRGYGVTKNNITGETWVSGEQSGGSFYSYEYDDEGYPTKRVWNGTEVITHFSYNK